MMLHRIVLGILAGSLAACTNNARPPAVAGKTPPQSPSADTANALREPAPDIPKDARWTIFCAAVGGPNHVSQARAMRDELVRLTRLRDWYIVHGENETTLYYGFYREIDERIDAGEAARKQADLKAINELINPYTGNRMFRTVFVAPLEGSDPPAPPDWNLANAKGDAFYTLQICVYKDSPERKQAAVDSVREARKQGVEAYFYHGATASSVCVGLFPRSAVRVTTQSSRPHGDPKNLDAEFVRPESVVAVRANPEIERSLAAHSGAEVLQDQVEVLDNRLKELMIKFPYHQINGMARRRITDPRTGQVKDVYSHSILVLVPGASRKLAESAGSRLSGQMPLPIQPTVSAPQATPPLDPFNRPPPRLPASKGGKLKSIED